MEWRILAIYYVEAGANFWDPVRIFIAKVIEARAPVPRKVPVQGEAPCGKWLAARAI